jgi:cytochrome P450
MNLHSPQHFVPPRPAPAPSDLGWLQTFAIVRTNSLRLWPQEAYENDVLVQSFLGRRRFLFNTPDAIHHVLVDNTAAYTRTPATFRILRPIIGNGLLLSEGEEWRHQRRTIAPTMTPRIVPMLARHVATSTSATLARLHAMRGPVDMLAAMQLLALEIAARSMFSLEMAEHGAALRAMTAQYAKRLARPYFLDVMLPVSIPTWHDMARRRFRTEWLKLMDAIIESRRVSPAVDGPRDLFDVLLAARDPETGAAFSREQLRDQIATLIVAGHETTALTLFWALYLLASAPAEQEQVAAEVRGLDLSPEHAADALSKLVITRAVVDEALRLFPPAFLIVRMAKEQDKVGDIVIPKGSMVCVAPWVLHRHHRLWREPDAFDPSRFIDQQARAHRFAYLPFGAGPRVCVGAQFALAEACLVLATLVQNFELTRADTSRVLPVGVVTTQPDHPAPFVLRARG